VDFPKYGGFDHYDPRMSESRQRAIVRGLLGLDILTLQVSM